MKQDIRYFLRRPVSFNLRPLLCAEEGANILGFAKGFKDLVMNILARKLLKALFLCGNKRPKPAFQTQKEAYDFCRNLYRTTGATPELRRAYEFYKKVYREADLAERL